MKGPEYIDSKAIDSSTQTESVSILSIDDITLIDKKLKKSNETFTEMKQRLEELQNQATSLGNNNKEVISLSIGYRNQFKEIFESNSKVIRILK